MSYRSPPQTRTRKMALVPRSARSHGRRLNVPEEIADLWLHRGVVAFFINPESTPNLATLLHCTQISAINFPPLCRGASLATHRSTLSPHFFPSSFSQRSFDLPILSLPPPLFSSFAFPYSSSLFASRAGGKRFQLRPSSPSRDPQPTPPLYGCTVRIVIGKQISMVVLKVSALMEPSIRSTKILVPSIPFSLSLSLSLSLSFSLSIFCFVRLTVSSRVLLSRGGIFKDMSACVCECVKGGKRVTWDECMAKISANVGIITRVDSRLVIVCCNLWLNVRGWKKGIVRERRWVLDLTGLP